MKNVSDSTRPASKRPRSFGVVILLVWAVSLVGCASSAWRQALEEDTPAAYHRFMRAHADSKYAAAARERLEFHQLQRNPTLAGYDAFVQRHPQSELLDRLHPALEGPAFEAARAAGTAEAYRGFLARFPGGALEQRALGNAVFVESGGFGGDPDSLAAFAEEHPDSDFAVEARRTARAVAARRSAGVREVALFLDVDATTPERNRVRAALIERISTLADRAGVRVRPSTAGDDDLPGTRLEVSHVERSVGTASEAGTLARPEIRATTEVVLRVGAGGDPIASRRFEVRVEDKAHVPGTSLLFAEEADRYWSEFFVPVATWQNDTTIRPAIPLSGSVVDVDGRGDRVVVLYEDGGFDLLGLADPARPVLLSSYERDRDHERWSGVRVFGDRIAIFGEEGLELVRFGEQGPFVERSYRRGEIGRVLSMTAQGEAFVITGVRGVQTLDPVSGEVRRVLRRVMKSVDAIGETLVFVDGESLYLSTLPLLEENRVLAQLELGKTFGPENVRVVDELAIVTGPGGALVVDLSEPRKPRALSRLHAREIGDVVDAARLRGRIFLVGDRGLQLLTRRLDGVEETIDVGPRNRVSVMGRHLVTSSAVGIQVVDTTPWAVSTSRPAAR